MQAKVICLALVFGAFLSLQALTPESGSNRLRELAVLPEMKLNFNFGMNSRGSINVITENTPLPEEISRLRDELKRQPEDVRQLMWLGDLLEQNGETNESEVCFQKAEHLCRTRVEARPQDGLALTDLGAALQELKKTDEAESVYRKAVLVSSNEWKCWARLGNFLASESLSLLFPTNSPGRINPQLPPQEIFEALGFRRPSANALEKSEALCNEGFRCFEKAVALAPKEPDVFFQRAAYMSMSNQENYVVRYLRNNEKFDPMAWGLGFFPKETISDLKKSSELNPKDYQYITMAAYATLVRDLPGINSINFTEDLLPDKDRQLVHTAITRLENVSQDPDEKMAAGALENLGFLHIASANFQAATADFKRAVSLDPTREQSWDLLLGTSLDSAKPEELAAICQSRLKYNNSARNHILLAKVFARQEKWDKATEQAEIARKLETNNIVPPLLLAAIALKQSERTNYLSIADMNMNRASAALMQISNDDEKHTRWREFMLNGAIFNALINQPEISKNWAKAVLKNFPDDETAKEILKALN